MRRGIGERVILLRIFSGRNGGADMSEKRKVRYTGGTTAATTGILTAGIMWGSMGIWVRRFTEAGLDAMQILALRVVVTVVLMTVFLSIYNRKLLVLNRKDLWCFLGTGICSIVFFGYCYNRTIVLASLSVAAILLYTAPIFVMILSRILFKEVLTARKVTALLMAFAGCICVTGILSDQSSISTMGILTGLGSGFGYALYSIFSRFALERGYHPFTVTLYTFVCAFAAVLFLADWHPLLVFVTESPGNFTYGIAYGVVTTVLPYILYTLGLSRVENSRASIMATVEPVVATLIGVFAFREKMTLTGAAGVILVLGALLLLNQKKRKNE